MRPRALLTDGSLCRVSDDHDPSSDSITHTTPIHGFLFVLHVAIRVYAGLADECSSLHEHTFESHE